MREMDKLNSSMPQNKNLSQDDGVSRKGASVASGAPITEPRWRQKRFLSWVQRLRQARKNPRILTIALIIGVSFCVFGSFLIWYGLDGKQRYLSSREDDSSLGGLPPDGVLTSKLDQSNEDSQKYAWDVVLYLVDATLADSSDGGAADGVSGNTGETGNSSLRVLKADEKAIECGAILTPIVYRIDLSSFNYLNLDELGRDRGELSFSDGLSDAEKARIILDTLLTLEGSDFSNDDGIALFSPSYDAIIAIKGVSATPDGVLIEFGGNLSGMTDCEKEWIESQISETLFINLSSSFEMVPSNFFE